MNRSSLFVLSAVLSLPLGVTMVNADNGATVLAEAKVDEGDIKSVDAKAKSFVLTVSGKDVTIKVNDQTKYTLDGKESTMERALAAGNKARVTHNDTLASKVDATSKKPS